MWPFIKPDIEWSNTSGAVSRVSPYPAVSMPSDMIIRRRFVLEPPTAVEIDRLIIDYVAYGWKYVGSEGCYQIFEREERGSG